MSTATMSFIALSRKADLTLGRYAAICIYVVEILGPHFLHEIL